MFNGCLDLFDDSDSNGPIRFCEAFIGNRDERRHDVSVEMIDNGEVVYGNSYELRAVEETDTGSSANHSIDSAYFNSDNISTHEGKFLFRVQINDNNQHEIDLTSAHAEPVSVLAMVTGEDEVSLHTKTGEDVECDSFSDSESID